MPPERTRPGLLAGPAGAALAALLAILLIGGLAAAFILSAAESRAAATAEREAAAGAASVGAALQAQIGQALDYGIPLEALPGIEDVFVATLQQVPSLAAIALDAGPVDVAAGTVPPGVPPLTFTVSGAAQGEVGTLQVWPAADPARAALGPLQGLAVLIVLAAALVAAGAAWLAARVSLARPAAEIGGDLDAIAAGTFPAVHVTPGRGAVARARRAVAALVERVAAQERHLRFLADEQRELDFDGSLTRTVDEALAPIAARWRFVEHDTVPTPAARPAGGWVACLGAMVAGALWLAATLAQGVSTDGTATLPLAPGFGLDLPLAALVAAALSLFLLGPAARRRPRLLAVGGFLIAALALVAPRVLSLAEVAASWPVAAAAIVSGAALAAALTAAWTFAGFERPAPTFLAAFGLAGGAVGAAAAATLDGDTIALSGAVILLFLALVSGPRAAGALPPRPVAAQCGPLFALAGAVPFGLALAAAEPSLGRVLPLGLVAVIAAAAASAGALRVMPAALSVALALVALAAVTAAGGADPAAVVLAALLCGAAVGAPAADGDGDRAAAVLAGVALGVLAPALADAVDWPAWHAAALLLGVPAVLGLACALARRGRRAA